jgi:hypothetical protein
MWIYKLHLQKEHTELKGSGWRINKRGKVTYLPNRNMNADCFGDRKKILASLKSFIKSKA